ncbi:SDR family NAD(P)-dependent oxidoreductase [Rubrivirga sp. IMCC45206]|uniref:SDR family NAD(P)-dependent oxidoreductase n=1 Tax=Rubrivirga sp. IMCC45206 TaxID=3391614 RepID=UPI00398FA656
MPALPDSFRLDSRVALVTGASRGIGEAMARALADAGAHVVVASRRQEAVDAVAASIRAAGGQATGRALHVGRADEIAEAVSEIADTHGGLHVLVNNAATSPVYGPVEETDERAFDQIMGVNLKGPFLLAQAALPYLSVSGGSILNVSSIGGVTPETGVGIYSVSKAALISLTQVMAKEWGRHGVRANAICPGLIQTQLSQPMWADEKTLARFTRGVPAGRIGVPEDLAGLAVFLASDASAYCTGGVFTVDGGYLVA